MTRATVLVLLGGVAAVVLVVLHAKPPEDRPRRPTDDAEVLAHVVPRSLTLDAGESGRDDSRDALDAGGPAAGGSGVALDAGETGRDDGGDALDAGSAAVGGSDAVRDAGSAAAAGRDAVPEAGSSAAGRAVLDAGSAAAGGRGAVRDAAVASPGARGTSPVSGTAPHAPRRGPREVRGPGASR